MRKLTAIAALAVVGLGTQTTAFGYGGTANLTFSWATNGTDIGWTSNGVNTLGSMTDGTYFSQQAGSNSTGYYNSDFASAAACNVAIAGAGGGVLSSTRKYGCRYTTGSGTGTQQGSPAFVSTPVADVGPGASASGTLTVTDTTLTGVLTIVSTTDEPTGGTATSVGNGTNGYNLRSADGSPFGNNWNGITTLGTYTVNLTGTFTASSWQITGGAATFSDAGFLCQQGGNSTPANILCSASSQPGGYQANGGALSWGWDLNGAGTGITTASEIIVRDNTGVSVVDTLSGVLANLSVDGLGNITTNSGEIRRALGASACGGAFIKWDGSKISCGTLSTADLVITGTAPVVPVPAAVWLFGSALGLLGVARRKMAA